MSDCGTRTTAGTSTIDHLYATLIRNRYIHKLIFLKIGLKVSASCSGHFNPEEFCMDLKNHLDTLEKGTSPYFCLEQKMLQEIL